MQQVIYICGGYPENIAQGGNSGVLGSFANQSQLIRFEAQ